MIHPLFVLKKTTAEEAEEEKAVSRKTPYDDLWELDSFGTKKQEKKQVTGRKKIPIRPEKDLLLFLEQYSQELTDWQRDVLSMMREEMLYFWPQLETKIMNEGWASFWHQRILREMNLTPEDTIEFAKLNANVIQPSKTQINPYHLGVKLFEDIEERYNHPTEEMMERGVKPNSGREKIFEVREMDSDMSFIRNYLTKEFIQREDMYIFEKKGKVYQITDQDHQEIRQQLISMRVNGGFPYIMVQDGDYLRNGELYLKHHYEETELDIPYLEHVLPYIYQLWGRTVHLETYLEGKPVRFTYNGKKVHRAGL